MHRLFSIFAAALLLLAAESTASPAEALRIQKSWELGMERWSLEIGMAATAEARAEAFAKRPDAAAAADEMWKVIAPSLSEEWTIEPAAWFLRASAGLPYPKEVEAIRKAVESHHLRSPRLIPMCMALVTTNDPRSLSVLEKITESHPDQKIQGVAALASAMILKTLGDDPELMRKRLTALRKAIVESSVEGSEVEIGDTTLAKLAEDELYIIRFLTKGRIAPDLSGTDSGGRPMKLSDHQGKVILLLFWNSTMNDAERVVEITRDMEKKLAGKPFVILGVNNDTLANLREMESSGNVPWRNFSDPTQELSRQYRIGSLPLAYVLDGERKVHYAGPQGSFAELTAEALLSEMPTASE